VAGSGASSSGAKILAISASRSSENGIADASSNGRVVLVDTINTSVVVELDSAPGTVVVVVTIVVVAGSGGVVVVRGMVVVDGGRVVLVVVGRLVVEVPAALVVVAGEVVVVVVVSGMVVVESLGGSRTSNTVSAQPTSV
jgi:hypothetical protein